MQADPFHKAGLCSLYLLHLYVCAVPLLLSPPRAHAQTTPANPPAADSEPGLQKGFVANYGQSPGWFPSGKRMRGPT